MNASQHTDVLRETDSVKEHLGNPRVDAVPQELCSTPQTPPRGLAGPSDEDAFETFVDGAGI